MLELKTVALVSIEPYANGSGYTYSVLNRSVEGRRARPQAELGPVDGSRRSKRGEACGW